MSLSANGNYFSNFHSNFKEHNNKGKVYTNSTGVKIRGAMGLNLVGNIGALLPTSCHEFEDRTLVREVTEEQ